MEVDGEGSLSILTTKFSREFTQLYLKMADSARQQSNYAVATRYLKLTEKAVKEVSVLSVNCTCSDRCVYYTCTVHASLGGARST